MADLAKFRRKNSDTHFPSSRSIASRTLTPTSRLLKGFRSHSIAHSTRTLPSAMLRSRNVTAARQRLEAWTTGSYRSNAGHASSSPRNQPCRPNHSAATPSAGSLPPRPPRNAPQPSVKLVGGTSTVDKSTPSPPDAPPPKPSTGELLDVLKDTIKVRAPIAGKVPQRLTFDDPTGPRTDARLAVHDSVSPAPNTRVLYDPDCVWKGGRLYHEPGNLASVWRGAFPSLATQSTSKTPPDPHEKSTCARSAMIKERGANATPPISLSAPQLLGIWYVTQWLAQGAPSKVRVIEVGPGRGTLLADILRVSPPSLCRPPSRIR